MNLKDALMKFREGSMGGHSSSDVEVITEAVVALSI